MPDLGVAIREYYDSAPPVRVDEVWDRGRTGLVAPRRRVLRPVVVVVVAALVTLAAVGAVGVLSLVGRDRTPAFDQVVTGPITWTRVDTRNAYISQVAALGEGFGGVRIYWDESGTLRRELVTSSDGILWSPVAGDLLTDGEEVLWVDGGAWGAAAEVPGPDGPEIIATLDGGATWVRSNPAVAAALPPRERWIQALSVGEAGLVAVYQSPGPEAPFDSVLWSPDGVSWHVVADPPEVLVVRAMGASAAGYVMVGEPAGPGNPGMASWLSVDGQNWEQVTITDQFVADVDSPARWQDGFLVSGVTYDQGTGMSAFRVWRSGDGMDWAEMDLSLFQGLVPERFVGSSDAVLAMARTDDSDAAAHMVFSYDGTEWHSWKASDVFGKENVLGYAIGHVNPVLAVWTTDSGGVRTNLWIGVPTASETLGRQS